MKNLELDELRELEDVVKRFIEENKIESDFKIEDLDTLDLNDFIHNLCTIVGYHQPEDLTVENNKVLIWSNEHNAYWRPNSMGYTRNINEAGRYTVDDALEICYNAGSEKGIPMEVIVKDG